MDTPQPALALELRYLLAWLNGAAMDLASHTELLDLAIESVEQRLYAVFEQEHGRSEGEPTGM